MSCQNFHSHECSECDNRTSVIASENKKKYILQNPNSKRVCKIKVDGCYNLNNNQEKCDYLILDCDGNAAYFIELKGANFLKAIDQIDASITRKQNKLEEFNINARIVLSKYNAPNIQNNPKYLRFIKRLKQLGGDLIKGTRQITETI
jgi:hypothetical protein